MIDVLFQIPVWHAVLLLLAAFRITRLITTDDMPLVASARNWLHARFPPSGVFMDGGPSDFPPRVQHAIYQNTGRGTEARWFIEKGHWLGKLTSCMWCAGFWVSCVATLAYGLNPTFAVVASIPWALSAGVGLLSNIGG